MAIKTHNLRITSSNPDTGILVTCSPADTVGASSLPTPGVFVCNDALGYVVTVPKWSGYSEFVKWMDLRPTPNVDIPDGTGGALGATLTVPPVSTNQSFRAVYRLHTVCTINVVATNIGYPVQVTASTADLDGKTTITTPGSFRFLDQTVVTFSVDNTVRITHQTPLDGKVTQIFDFIGWRESGSLLKDSKSFKLKVLGDHTFELNYDAGPMPWSPSDVDVLTMNEIMKMSVPPIVTRDAMILLWDGRPVKIFNNWVYKDTDHALAAARKLFLVTEKEWINRLPNNELKAWARDPQNQKKYMDYWLSTYFTVMDFETFRTSKLTKVRQTSV